MKANERIKCVREYTRMAQPDFAAFIGAKGNQISNIENEKQKVPHEILEAIAKKFPKFKLWILTGEEYPDIDQVSPMTEEIRLKNQA